MTQFIRETGPKNLNRCTVSERKTGSQPRDDKTTSTRTERHSHRTAQLDSRQGQPNSTRAQPTNPTTRSAELSSHAAPLYRRSSAPTPLLSVGGAQLPRRYSLSAEPSSHAVPLCHPSRQRVASEERALDSKAVVKRQTRRRAAVNRGRWGKPTEENEKSRGISSDAFKKVTTTMSPSPVRTSGQGFHPGEQTGWRRESVASREGMAPEGVNDLCTSKPGRAFARGSTP